MQNQILPKNKILLGPLIIKIKEEDVKYVFMTSDIHHAHNNILHFTQRGGYWKDIDEMGKGIVQNMNDAISSFTGDERKKTILFHCGDIQFGSKGGAQERYKWLQDNLKYQTVYCVTGNHDVYNVLHQHELITSYNYNSNDGTYCNPNWFWNHMYIVEIYRQQKCICQFTVSHFPMEEFHGQFNIHGHLHTRPKIHVKDEDSYINMERWIKTGHHLDVGVDNNDYRPVSLYDIMAGNTQIQTKYNLPSR